MVSIGIDKISFYTSPYYLELSELAKHRGVDVDKFHIGLGQRKMAVPAPDEDSVTLAANATERLLQGVNIDAIDTIMLATETGIDQSKAAGIYVHSLLSLAKHCRIVELKQACYSGTQALQMAVALVQRFPDKKVLVITTDIADYGFNTAGEPSQGCGAVAMLISTNPRLLSLEPHYGVYSDDIMDFWRPNYRQQALVEGKYSAKMYIQALKEVWKNYQDQGGHTFSEHDYFLYHAPISRLVEKAHRELAKLATTPLSSEQAQQHIQAGLQYGREVGNSYTASLYLGLVSLLDNAQEDLANKRVGFYSYGSGCVAEYFSAIVQPHYRQVLDSEHHQRLLAERQALSFPQYQEFLSSSLPTDGSALQLPSYHKRGFRLAGIENHQRIYERNETHDSDIKIGNKEQQNILEHKTCAIAPAKLILSGEHAVVYGKPALALAINRFAETEVLMAEGSESIAFDLKDLSYHKSIAKQTLRDLRSQLKQKYHQFLSNECHISDVLKQPFQLVQFATAHLLEHLEPQRRHQGLTIKTRSAIPVGCGMGSSAAVTLSVLRALNAYYQTDNSVNGYFEMAADIENLQHGNSSGIDIAISLSGGCIYFNQGSAEQRQVPNIPMYLVNTGQPQSTTGETVMSVRKQFQDSKIWNEFAQVTIAMDQALQNNDLKKVPSLIHRNHQLLCQIGVVPPTVRSFINEAWQLGAAAKICGAGSIRGDQAGVVWLVTHDKSKIEPLCRRYHYQLETIVPETQGLRIA